MRGSGRLNDATLTFCSHECAVVQFAPPLHLAAHPVHLAGHHGHHHHGKPVQRQLLAGHHRANGVPQLAAQAHAHCKPQHHAVRDYNCPPCWIRLTDGHSRTLRRHYIVGGTHLFCSTMEGKRIAGPVPRCPRTGLHRGCFWRVKRRWCLSGVPLQIYCSVPVFVLGDKGQLNGS